MNKINKFLTLTFIGAMILAACSKVADLPDYPDGMRPVLSASKSSLSPAVIDSNKVVLTLNWTNPNYSNDEKTTKYIVQIDSLGGNFVNAFSREVIGKFSTSFTGKELNNILFNFGTSPGAPYKMKARIISSYGNNNERYNSNIVNITITAFGEPSKLTTTATTVTGTLATGNQNALTFNWTKAFNSYTGVVTYSLEYDSVTKGFSSPKSINVGPSILTQPLLISEVNEHANNAGIAYNKSGKIEYRVKAVTALGATIYSNAVTITVNTYLPILPMYLVGDINGWNINNPLQMIFDKKTDRYNKVYFTYVKLDAGNKFKFVLTPGNWGSAYGNTGASGGGFTTGYNQGSDFQVATSGIYRLTIDVSNKLVYVQQKQVGVVGNMQGWNPSAPIFGAYASRDRFLIIANSNGTDKFKFHEGPEWNNSTPEKTRWWGMGTVAGNLDNDGNGADIPATTSPRTRCVWDGTDKQQVKYNLYPADQMRLVGDGIDSTGVLDWNPGTSPRMTYLGNGKWQINIKLKGSKSIKFLSGDNWGAFDYEDRGDGGTVGTNIVRKISWDDAAGTNFGTPASSGRYTITLDENAQTVTITP